MESVECTQSVNCNETVCEASSNDAEVDDIVLVSNIDSLLSKEAIIEDTLRNRTANYVVSTYDGMKHGNFGRKRTGNGYHYADCRELCCVDIDIHENLYVEEKNEEGKLIRKHAPEDVCKEIDEMIAPLISRTCIERTASDGYHIYCNINDAFKVFTSGSVKAYKGDRYDVDIFAYVEKEGSSNRNAVVCFNESLVYAKYNKLKVDHSCRWINEDGIDDTVDVTFEEVIKALKIDYDQIISKITKGKISNAVNVSSTHSTSSTSTSSSTPTPLTSTDLKVFDVLLGAFTNEASATGGMSVIHNDGGNAKYSERLSLFSLFSIAKKLPDVERERLIEAVRNCPSLTSKARDNFDIRLNRFTGNGCNGDPIGILTNVIKSHHREYYDQYVKPIINAENNKEIEVDGDVDDLDRKFSTDTFGTMNYNELRNRVKRGSYKSIEDVAVDMAKVFRMVDSQQLNIYVCVYDADLKRNMIRVDKLATWEKMMIETPVKGLRKSSRATKDITLKEIFVAYRAYLAVDAVVFNKEIHGKSIKGNHPYISIFNGLHYIKSNVDLKDDLQDPLPSASYELEQYVDPLLNHLRYLFNDDAYYDWFIKWCALIIQYPGIKTKVVPCLFGVEGTGKSIFVDFLVKVLLGYATSLDSVEQICGKFTSIAAYQCLVCIGEAEKMIDNKIDYSSNSKLKRLITDNQQVLEKKGIDAVSIDSIINIIITTNYLPYGLFSGKNDRRLSPIKVSDYWLRADNKHDHFAELFRLVEDANFLVALTHYFLSIDLTGFKVEEIPLTVCRYELIANKLFAVDRNHYQRILVSLYHDLYKGVTLSRLQEIIDERYRNIERKEKKGDDSTEVRKLSVYSDVFKRLVSEYVQLESDGRYKRASAKWLRVNGFVADDNSINKCRIVILSEYGRKELLTLRKMAIELGVITPIEDDQYFDELEETLETIKTPEEDLSAVCGGGVERTQEDIIIEEIKRRYNELCEGIPTSEFAVEGVNKKEVAEFMSKWCVREKSGQFKRKRFGNGSRKNCFVLNDDGKRNFAC